MLIKILRRQRVVRWTKQYQLCNAKKKTMFKWHKSVEVSKWGRCFSPKNLSNWCLIEFMSIIMNWFLKNDCYWFPCHGAWDNFLWDCLNKQYCLVFTQHRVVLLMWKVEVSSIIRFMNCLCLYLYISSEWVMEHSNLFD